MPHIVVNLYAGRTEEKKREVAKQLKKTAVEICGFPETAVSVSVIDYQPEDFAPEMHKLYKDENLYESSKYIYK